MDANLMNGLSLAYIGDAYYELLIRQHLLEKKLTKVNELHKYAIKYTSGEAQASIIDYFLENNFLTNSEIEIYKKGRNSTNSHRKNLSLALYQKATGFEALIGYLYENSDFDRLNILLNIIYDFVEHN